MKRWVLLLVAVLTLICVNSAIAAEWSKTDIAAAGNVNWIGNRSFFYNQNKGVYVLRFYLKDKYEEFTTCPCTVEARWVNVAGEEEFTLKKDLTDSDFLNFNGIYETPKEKYAVIEIPPTFFDGYRAKKGSVYIKVLMPDGRDFAEKEICKYDLRASSTFVSCYGKGRSFKLTWTDSGNVEVFYFDEDPTIIYYDASTIEVYISGFVAQGTGYSYHEFKLENLTHKVVSTARLDLSNYSYRSSNFDNLCMTFDGVNLEDSVYNVVYIN